MAEQGDPLWARFSSVSYQGNDPWFAAPLATDEYRNPILAGYHPDPSVCRIGDAYYLVCSSFGHFPGLPIYRSANLVDWEPVGHAVDRPDQVNFAGLELSRGLYAPTLREHAGRCYLTCTMVGAGDNFVMTADRPEGPWSDPVWLDCKGIDPALFFDDDGQAYLFHNDDPPGPSQYEGHKAIWAQRFDTRSLSLIGPRVAVVDGGVDLRQKPIWVEGPKAYKRGGLYYLSCAEGGTFAEHSQVIFRASAPMGPYTPAPNNPILTQRDVPGSAITCAGHAEFVTGPDGRCWATFLGCRPHAPDRYITGRETFLLPVDWPEGGFPTIVPPRTAIAPVARRPAGTTGTQSGLTGNGSWRDDFAAPQLSGEWLMLRAPTCPWWRCGNAGLELEGRGERLRDRANPSFLGRRIGHARFSATTELAVPPRGVRAGLVALQNDTHSVFVGVRWNGDALDVFVERVCGSNPETLATRTIPATGSVTLAIQSTGDTLAGLFGTDGKTLETLVQTDTDVLTTHVAGGFVGAVVGPYAERDAG